MDNEFGAIEVQLLADGFSEPLQQIYAGLRELHVAGKIRVVLTSRFQTRVVKGSPVILWARARDVTRGVTRKLCFDMGDGGRVVSAEGLEECDIYFKRSYHAPAYEKLPERSRLKILPYGLNAPCVMRSGVSFKMRLAFEWLKNGGSSPSYMIEACKEGVRLVMSEVPLRVLDRHRNLASDDLTVSPDAPASPKILFQTKVWDLKQHSPNAAVVEQLNDFRANTVRVLREKFGDAFVGGIVPTPFAKAQYPDCLSNRPTDQKSYVQLMKDCLIGVCTIGLHGSTSWKISEYLAASRCIVSERLKHELPTPLEEGKHYVGYDTPEGVVSACERILGNPTFAQSMREANHSYYEREVKPDTLLLKCLQRALA